MTEHALDKKRRGAVAGVRRSAAPPLPNPTLTDHPANAEIVGPTMPSAVCFTTDDLVASLDEGWEPVVIDDDVPRHTVDAEGRPITLRCAMVQVRRGPAALAG